MRRQWKTVAEIAFSLGTSRQSVHDWISRKGIRVHTVGRVTIVPVEELYRFRKPVGKAV